MSSSDGSWYSPEDDMLGHKSKNFKEPTTKHVVFGRVSGPIDQIVEDNDTGFTNSRWSMATKEFKSERGETKEQQDEEDLFKKIGNWWEKEVLKKNENEGIQQ